MKNLPSPLTNSNLFHLCFLFFLHHCYLFSITKAKCTWDRFEKLTITISKQQTSHDIKIKASINYSHCWTHQTELTVKTKTKFKYTLTATWILQGVDGGVEVGVVRGDTGEWHWSRRGPVWTAKQNTRRLCMWELSSQGEEHFMHGFWSSQGNPFLSTEGTRGKCNKSCIMHQVSDLINTTVFGGGEVGSEGGGVGRGRTREWHWSRRRPVSMAKQKMRRCRCEKNCHPRWWKGMCYAWHSEAHIQSPVIYIPECPACTHST